MARITIPDEGKTVSGFEPVRSCLAEVGIDYQRWEPSHPLASDAPAEDVLAAYGREIDRLKAEGGYVTADVIDVKPTTPGLEGMLQKFRSEHWHDEDEV
ncbi:MAG TPA: acireductone dioxygenase, partial [Vicinamibacteria bacterium]